MRDTLGKIVLGGGCFWCLEAVFRHTRGILCTASGYSGGAVKNPTYEQVCSGETGHAEVVELTYDKSLITLESILEIFFSIHDPTQKNRQGNDVGTQYRSVIYYSDEEQQTIINDYIARLKVTRYPNIVTEISPLGTLYYAETYHQNYFEKNPSEGYCAFVVSPKVEMFKTLFPSLSN